MDRSLMNAYEMQPLVVRTPRTVFPPVIPPCDALLHSPWRGGGHYRGSRTRMACGAGAPCRAAFCVPPGRCLDPWAGGGGRAHTRAARLVGEGGKSASARGRDSPESISSDVRTSSVQVRPAVACIQLHIVACTLPNERTSQLTARPGDRVGRGNVHIRFMDMNMQPEMGPVEKVAYVAFLQVIPNGFQLHLSDRCTNRVDRMCRHSRHSQQKFASPC